jgi:adenylate cyclase class 1
MKSRHTKAAILMKTESSIVTLAAKIRDFSHTPVSADPPDLAGLAEEFLDAVRDVDPGEATHAAPIAETGLNVYRIIQSSKDSMTIRSCLRILLGIGRFGRILAARFVLGMAVPLRELAAMVSSIPVPDRLALAHEMLRSNPAGFDRQMLAWLEGLMQPLAAADPSELALFVASLGREGETLAFPARQVIMNGLFGKWMETRLKTGADAEDLAQLCYLVRALDDPEQAMTLAVSMSVGFITPTRLALETVAGVAEAGDKRVLNLFLASLKSGDRNLAGAGLDGIIAQNTPNAGKLLATIRRKMPSLRRVAATRAPLLGDAAYQAYLDALTREEQDKARTEAFGALLGMAPDFVEALTRAGTGKPMAGPGETGGQPVAGDEIEPLSCHKPGFFARLFGTRKKTLEKLLPKFRNLRDLDLVCSKVESMELEGRELTDLNLAGSSFRETEFIRSKISGTSLRACTFGSNAITGCTFNAVDFSGSDFEGTAFANCSFNDCNFTGTAFANCEFSDCRFRNCTMGGSAFLAVHLTRTGFTTSVLAGANFHEVEGLSCRFENVNLTAANFVTSRFKGLEFIDCIIRAATLNGTRFHAVDMPGSSVANCLVHNCDLPHALFLSAQLDQYARLATGLERKKSPDPTVIRPEVASKVLAAWSRELSFLRRERRMLEHNRTRLTRALDCMERSKQAYLRILPHIINTDVFEKKFDLKNIPHCEIWGYTPGLTTLELAGQFFPDAEPSKGRADIRILAVYAMGSLGTVAQTAQSDIDCWVCYDGDVGMDAEAGLKRKLDALGLWAESEFGLEAHFFPMRMEDVRDNRFSSGDDEESSGSAQALLLKEEFYRTALRIAGKSLAWWVTPAGVDCQDYGVCIQSARRYPVTGQPRLEDFGHLAPVPPDEYFGGSLWQMVKAIHSPFKSVLKLGLLETYADAGASSLPLCDRIKNNLFMHRRGVRRTDPYGALFSTLHSHHARRGDKTAARLLTESFMFKANLCDIPFFMNLPARREDASLIRALFGKGYVDPDRVCNSNVRWNFDKSLRMGSSVRQYMVGTYQRIRKGIRGGDKGSRINAEDMTRMGRRIGANFSKKAHKVMRVPFMDATGEEFALLHFSANKNPGKKTIWEVRGGSRSEAKRAADNLQVLHRSGDPVHLLAWLFANRIYNPKSHLQGDRTVAPISVADLQKLMPALLEFFPFDETFERDINEGLEPERVVRAFFICNLTTAPDVQRIEQAAVIYSTNWGELFCRTFLRPDPIIEKTPSKFLAMNLEQHVSGIPEMILFIPKGSQCKRINLT